MLSVSTVRFVQLVSIATEIIEFVWALLVLVVAGLALAGLVVAELVVDLGRWYWASRQTMGDWDTLECEVVVVELPELVTEEIEEWVVEFTAQEIIEFAAKFEAEFEQIYAQLERGLAQSLRIGGSERVAA